MTTMNGTANGQLREELRLRVLDELSNTGFVVQDNELRLPEGSDGGKDTVRKLHWQQRQALLQKNLTFLSAWEDKLIDRFAEGAEVDPAAVHPAVVPVVDEADAALFRMASLHWSVPVSQGYGRRTRFLVLDQSNNKLIGIFALGDPVFNLGVRDRLIGWDQEQRQKRLYNVFDAFVLGAVDPYRQLLGGKLVALCTVANETSAYLTDKYAGTRTVIKNEVKSATPVLITTTSALGRSSIYNRIKFREHPVFQSIGFTSGFGHFHFSDSLFESIVEYLKGQSDDVRGSKFGDGPNWRIRTLRRGLEELGLDGDFLRHGVNREVFIAPRGIGWRAFLRGESNRVTWFDYKLDELATFWRERWAVPRAGRDEGYLSHHRDSLRLLNSSMFDHLAPVTE